MEVTRKYSSKWVTHNEGFGRGWSSPLLKKLGRASNYLTYWPGENKTIKLFPLSGTANIGLGAKKIFGPIGQKSCKVNNIGGCSHYAYINDLSEYVVVVNGAEQNIFGITGPLKRVVFSSTLESMKMSGGTPISQVSYGPVHYYSYKGNKLDKIRHSSGQTLTFIWGNQIISQIKDHNNNTFYYSYNYNNANLTTVTSPENSLTSYHYEDTNLPSHMTGISYNNLRYSWFEYDGLARPWKTTHSNGIDEYTIDYFENNATAYNRYHTITNPLGHQSKRWYKPVLSGDSTILLNYQNTSDKTLACQAAASLKEYNNDASVESSYDMNGNKTSYYYDVDGNLEKKVIGVGTSEAQTLEWELDDKIKRYKSKTVNGIKSSYLYHTYGYLASQTLHHTSGNKVIEYQYEFHPSNLIKKKTIITKGQYGADALEIEKYNEQGLLTSITDPEGLITVHSNYDDLGRVGKIKYPDGTSDNYEYDGKGRVKKLSQCGVYCGNAHPSVTYKYNRFGKVETATFNTGIIISFEYDAAARLFKLSTHKGNDVDVEEYERNKRGDILSIKKYKNSALTYQKTFSYDTKGQLMSTKNHANKLQELRNYDGNGNTSFIYDRSYHYYDYNALNKVSSIYSPDARTDQSFSYNKFGLYLAKDSENTPTTFIYNLDGVLASTDSTATGITTKAFNPYTGNVKSTTDNKGNTRYSFYDDKQRKYFEYNYATGNYTNFFFGTTGSEANKLNRFTMTTKGNIIGESTLEYDPVFGKLSEYTQNIENNAYNIGYKYDLTGKIEELTYPGGNSIRYKYDTYGELIGLNVIINGVEKTLIRDIKRKPFGPISDFEFGNGLKRTKSYDLSYLIENINTSGVQNLSYTWDEFNLIKNISNTLSSSYSQSFTYDQRKRLKSITAGFGNESFTYLDNGNRKTHTTDSNTKNYVYPSSYVGGGNRLKQINTVGSSTIEDFIYDDNGNIIEIGSGHGSSDKKFTYNGLNRMIGYMRHEYRYNALGQRSYKKALNQPSTHFVYDLQGTLLSEGANKQYIYLGGEIVAYINSDRLYYVHNDQLGRPEVLTDSNKSVRWKAGLKPFDRTVFFSSVGDFNIGFPGQYWDEEKGSYYNMFRDYDPETGRYLQSDPIGLAGGMNTYAYVGGNPLTRIDPLGLDYSVCNYGMHIGIGVNTTSTMGRRPANGITSDALLSKDVPGEVSADSGGKKCTTIKTTSAQDIIMQNYISQNILNPGAYNLLGRSCVDFVRDGLSQSLGMQFSNTNIPGVLFNEISGSSGTGTSVFRSTRGL